MLDDVTADTEGETYAPAAAPQLVLCAVDEPLAQAWQAIAADREGVSVHRGSVLDVPAQAVVSPANSFGWMRGGIDAVYAQAFSQVEARVRSAVLALHGGELPVGEAVVVPTGVSVPAWLISAPTMRDPGERLPADTVHPYLAARAVLRLWATGRFENGAPVRASVHTIAMPGLGTGVGGVAPAACARQVAAAWDEVFTELTTAHG
ncbi:macro domain-containing protein [Goodfellowiella coeruleoviolacea]|uniref:O-acetyl-ADP-ribose deacetylase (Regulator of RNase III), contains Macro domain n=1 Tax=Goodfellowiella coeruleoviolacea TaxID=334858 RepID=A0AAE3KF01_9PSEU|nr:macro domain-containing protein [Goodfellowiella coeruleoviolacea]MCP2164375.1 O-acetyl-ADP-ribose deacetylase (regulator of RNase III), contains Macro domain [Goodfellowiella coeruleoviolacea]